MKKFMLLTMAGLLTAVSVQAADVYVSPTGNDASPGNKAAPFLTLEKARQAVQGGGTVILAAGTYYLDQPLVLTAADSGTTNTPVTYRAEKGAEVVISGGRKLDLSWVPLRDGILKAKTPAGLVIDQLFVNGQRRHMARYPNYDAKAFPYNGAAADAFSPARAAGWANPAGGYIHAMHRARWGGYHYRITGKKENNEVTYEGGWQNNRQMGMHVQHRFVENVFEELDAPGEWYHDADANVLYYLPDKGLDVGATTFEIVRLPHLVELQGSQTAPVKYVDFRGLTFRHASRTFMDTKEPLLRSDWMIYRGGAVLFNGAEDCTLADCDFDQLGGNSVFVNNYNRRITLTGCHIRGSGASAVAFVGDPNAVRNPLFEYHQQQSFEDIDKTPGPKSDNYPADCLVDDCLIHDVGVVEKQATGVQLSMAKGVTVRHCSIYDVGRAGINISEGTFGGHVIEFCDVFDTVRETHDHGSFNSWGRDRFWRLRNVPAEELPQLALLDVEKNIIRNSRWRCDHGWDVDLDDGSSNYEIYNNLFLSGGLKLREGFHRRVYNNIAVNNALHPHVWYANSGDVVTGNIWMHRYRPAGGMPKGQWGKEVDRNLFTDASDKDAYSKHGCDQNSLVGDPLFVAPEKGDFRVQDGSPAMKIGFRNFPMDQFGVRKPELRKLARTPVIPPLGPITAAEDQPRLAEAVIYWQGTPIKGLAGEEFSAFGVSREDGGIHLIDVPTGSLAADAGLKSGDLVQNINGRAVKTAADLLKATDAAAGKPLVIKFVRGQVTDEGKMTRYVYVVTESGSGSFKTLPLLRQDAVRAFQEITTAPNTNNQSLEVLSDGELAKNYGPVFGNGVFGGTYKMDLGEDVPVTEVRSWSYGQGGNRGTQRFTLFGSAANKKRVPIATVNAVAQGPSFTATSIRVSDGAALGNFQTLEWVTQPVTWNKENTAFQELQLQ